MDNPNVDAWMKATTESIQELKRILLEIRDAQVEAFVRAARMAQPAQGRSYLDFRQPRRDGDSYQNAAWPGSPNQGAKHAKP